MGIRVSIARCNDCEDKKCSKCWDAMEGSTFEVAMEWMSKEKLIKHIQDIKCPCCGSDNWSLTDASEL